VHAAVKVLTTSTGNTGSSGSNRQSSKQQQQPWVPLLPAARAALPAVLVHTEGVSKTAAMLLHQYEEWQAQQPAVAAAAGRKQLKSTKRAALAPSNTAAAGAAANLPPLLSLPVLNSFFAAAADAARAAAAAADDEDAALEAAADAVRVAEVLFARQLLQVKTGLATSGEQHQPLLSPAAETYAALAQLYGAARQSKTVASIVMAAVRHQLPLEAVRHQLPLTAAPNSSSSSRGEMLQTVLAGAAAAAWLSAGRAAVVPWLLDGLVASGQVSLSHPGLAAAVLAAADDDLEVRGGWEGSWQSCRLRYIDSDAGWWL
jgi:hypothetical protein